MSVVSHSSIFYEISCKLFQNYMSEVQRQIDKNLKAIFAWECGSENAALWFRKLADVFDR